MPSYQRDELPNALFETSFNKIVKGKGMLGCTVGRVCIDVGYQEYSVDRLKIEKPRWSKNTLDMSSSSNYLKPAGPACLWRWERSVCQDGLDQISIRNYVDCWEVVRGDV